MHHHYVSHFRRTLPIRCVDFSIHSAMQRDSEDSRVEPLHDPNVQRYDTDTSKKCVSGEK